MGDVYVIELTVTDDLGNQVSDSIQVSVLDSSTIPSVVADFVAGSQKGNPTLDIWGLSQLADDASQPGLPVDMYLKVLGAYTVVSGPSLTPNAYTAEGAIKIGELTTSTQSTPLVISLPKKGQVQLEIWGVDEYGRETMRQKTGMVP